MSVSRYAGETSIDCVLYFLGEPTTFKCLFLQEGQLAFRIVHENRVAGSSGVSDAHGILGMEKGQKL